MQDAREKDLGLRRLMELVVLCGLCQMISRAITSLDEAVTLGVLAVDTAGVIIFCNQAA